MPDIHETLSSLLPVDWADVPKDDASLSPWLADLFHAGELLCNSVPPPADGTPFASCSLSEHKPNAARSHKDMVASLARPYPPDHEHEELQKNWGKPMKFSRKDNPLNVAVYKMAGHDRHGAWFARRSVHEGLGFSRFKKAMETEFMTSLAVQGGPGAGNVRGIGADRRIEHRHVEDGNVTAEVEVWELSSSFPGPTTPRDFLILGLSSSDCLTDKSGAVLGSGNREDGKVHVPRHWMLVSRPTTHPESPTRSGLIRGQYESVELIREIPLHIAKNATQSMPNLSQREDGDDGRASRSRGATVSSNKTGDNEQKHHVIEKADESGDQELNPVEWIMITRSDPGGGIPRFLVDRGTPGQMLVDVHKFLDHACKEDAEEPSNASETAIAAEETAAGLQAQKSDSLQMSNGPSAVQNSRTEHAPALDEQPQGMFANVTHALQGGIDAYAPTAVSQFLHTHGLPVRAVEDDDDSDPSSVISSTAGSFMSAEENQSQSLTVKGAVPGLLSQESLVSNLSQSTPPEMARDSKKLNQHEKEVLKLARQKQKLMEKMEKKRKNEEERLLQAKEKETADAEKAKERHEQQMRKAEERHQKEMEKLEKKKERELQKAEEKRRKQDDRDVLSRVTRERDDFRDQADLLRKENELLHAQVLELQQETTALVARLGKLGVQGNEALKSVRDDISSRTRSSSLKSVDRVKDDSESNKGDPPKP